MEELINGKTLEGVKASLTMCTEGKCDTRICLYKDDGETRCSDFLMSDALSLIKHLEMRTPTRSVPMTLEEVKGGGDELPCWIEEKYVLYPDVLAHSKGVYHGRIQTAEGVLPKSAYLLNEDEYGKSWRCWLKLPTMEERYAAPWRI